MTEPTPTPTPEPTPTAWHTGADPEVLGFLQSKGWDSKPANEAAMNAVKSYFEAQKLIGAPPESTLRLPKDANDEAGWNLVHTRLGRPDAADKYDFTAVKRGDQPLAQADVDFYRAQAFAAGMTQDRAVQFVQAQVARETSAATSAATEAQAKFQEAEAKLKANWGANFDANKFVAGQAAAKLGVTPEEVAGMEKVIGYDKTMEFFRSIGEKIGEASFIQNANPANPGVMTREQAMARKKELMSDQAWVKRYNEGGAAEMREMTALISLEVAG